MGISLAIPIDEVMRVVHQLKANGKVTRGRIGVQIGQVSEDVAKALGLNKAKGSMVSSVEADAPADDAGVQSGAVISKFNGKDIPDRKSVVWGQRWSVRVYLGCRRIL